MRWGVEVWDRFEDVSGYVHKGVEFCERFEEFIRKRCSIENSYAKSLRKLADSFEPKLRKEGGEQSTHVECFARMLAELKDVAGQHELIAESCQEHVIKQLAQNIRTLKEEKRKCIEEKEQHFTDYLNAEDCLEKAKAKYERAHKDLLKAEEQLVRVENDDSASRNDIKKQKAVCDQKRRVFDALGADYAKQLSDTNVLKNKYYFEHLPRVFDSLQIIEEQRIRFFQQLVLKCVSVDSETLPIIGKCLQGISHSAQEINIQSDLQLVASMFKTGYQVPADHVFNNLTEKDERRNAQLNGSLNSSNSLSNGTTTSTVGKTLLTNGNSRQKKYRTLNRIKGLFASGTVKSEEECLYQLPPEQRKIQLTKKIQELRNEIDKQQKEREGLFKLKDIYSKNEKFGDSRSADQALLENEEKLEKLNEQLNKYRELYNQTQSSSSSSLSSFHLHNHEMGGNQTNHSSEYSSSSHSGEVDINVQVKNVYHSPSDNSVNNQSSGAETPSPSVRTRAAGFNSASHQTGSAAAYAVSPFSQMISSCRPQRDASFDQDDDDDDDDDINHYTEECYETPNLITNSQKNSPSTGRVQDKSKQHESQPPYPVIEQSQYDHVTDTYTTSGSGGAATGVCAFNDEPVIGTALVIYAFTSSLQNAMSIEENESLNVLEKDSGDGWTLAKRLNGEKGYVPTDYIRIVFY